MGADATRKSPGIGRAGGPGDLDYGGGWQSLDDDERIRRKLFV